MATELLFFFILGSIAGWILETIIRNYKTKKFINPGFLKGPYLPIYGFGLIAIYLISISNINIAYKLILFITSITILEFTTGIIFLKYFKTKFWNYPKEESSYKGIISAQHSISWLALSLIAYFPIIQFQKELISLATTNPITYLTLGIFLIMTIDWIIQISKYKT